MMPQHHSCCKPLCRHYAVCSKHFMVCEHVTKMHLKQTAAGEAGGRTTAAAVVGAGVAVGGRAVGAPLAARHGPRHRPPRLQKQFRQLLGLCFSSRQSPSAPPPFARQCTSSASADVQHCMLQSPWKPLACVAQATSTLD